MSDQAQQTWPPDLIQTIAENVQCQGISTMLNKDGTWFIATAPTLDELGRIAASIGVTLDPNLCRESIVISPLNR